MTESEIRTQLQKSLHGRMTWAEWQHLNDTGLVGDYSRGDLGWQDFREEAEDTVGRLRRFYANKQRELSEGIEIDDEAKPSAGGDSHQGSEVSSLSERTFARSTAMGSLNWLRTGGPSGRAPIHGTLFPRGGLDGTLPQWVYAVAVELWVPAEEVMRSYRRHQQIMLAEPNPPKTSERAFEVASFVWQVEAHHGARLPWPEMWKLWNERPLTAPFKSWRDFRTYFERGAKATPPRYVASNEQIAAQVRSHNPEDFDDWASTVRE